MMQNWVFKTITIWPLIVLVLSLPPSIQLWMSWMYITAYNIMYYTRVFFLIQPRKLETIPVWAIYRESKTILLLSVRLKPKKLAKKALKRWRMKIPRHRFVKQTTPIWLVSKWTQYSKLARSFSFLNQGVS